MNIGEKIKNLRLAQQLTQEELANRADLTKGFISLLERDLQSPSLDTLENILNALDTSPGEFFEEDGQDIVVFSRKQRVTIEEEDRGEEGGAHCRRPGPGGGYPLGDDGPRLQEPGRNAPITATSAESSCPARSSSMWARMSTGHLGKLMHSTTQLTKNTG